VAEGGGRRAEGGTKKGVKREGGYEGYRLGKETKLEVQK